MAAFLPRMPRLRRALMLADVVTLVVGIWLAHQIRFNRGDLPFKWGELFSHPWLLVTVVAGLLAVAVAAELYEPMVLRRRREIILRISAVTAVWGALIAVATYFVPTWQFGRGLLLLTAATWAVIALALRLMLAQRVRGRNRPPALVVGTPEAVTDVLGGLSVHPLFPWEATDASGLTADAVAAAVREREGEVVIIAGGAGASTGLAGELAALHFAGVPVVVASEVWAWLDGRLPLEELSPALFLHQPGFGAVHWELFNRLTRVADVCAAVTILVVTLPLLLLAGLAVLVTDGFPVLYRQVRLGQFGRPFTIYKLRTMRRDAEENGPAFAAPSDPRVTRVGSVLRRLRLDELPQLVNVLRGHMSLVGPRPERPGFAAELARAIPYYTFRLAVPPGLTGWAQVNLPYARTEEEHRTRLEYDLYFIRERSIGLYALTLLRTVSVALFGIRR